VQYADRAKTGRTTGGRSELLRLIRDAEEGKIGRLFVYKFDRLGRAAETHVLIEDLEACGVEVASATEGTNSLARGVQLVVAADFSRALAERTRAGLIKRHEAGYHTGGPAPYGYKVIDTPDGRKKLSINETEAQEVRWIFEQYLGQGHGLKQIGRLLEERGIPTRLGGSWCFTTIRGIITNRMLTGEIVYLRRNFKLDRSTGRRVPRANKVEDQKVRIDENLRILDDGTFQRAQAKLAENRRDYVPRPRNQVRAFTRMMFCAECGSVCCARKSKNAKGEYYYYGCGCRQSKGPASCSNGKFIREDILQQRVMEALGEMFLDADDMIEEAVKLAERQIEGHREESGRIKSELSALDDKISSYLPLLADRDIEPQAKKAISRQIAIAQTRQDQLRAALNDIGEQSSRSASELVLACREAFQEARQAFMGVATAEQFNRLVEVAVGPMVLFSDGTIAQKQATADEDGRLARSVAGACSDPVCAAVSTMFRAAASLAA
jgi:site-specific DNA recombinase